MALPPDEMTAALYDLANRISLPVPSSIGGSNDDNEDDSDTAYDYLHHDNDAISSLSPPSQLHGKRMIREECDPCGILRMIPF